MEKPGDLVHVRTHLDDTGERMWATYLGDDLYGREVDYLIDQEWAMTAADVLWRRSKLGLHLAPATVAALESWFGNRPSRQRAGAP